MDTYEVKSANKDIDLTDEDIKRLTALITLFIQIDRRKKGAIPNDKQNK